MYLLALATGLPLAFVLEFTAFTSVRLATAKLRSCMIRLFTVSSDALTKSVLGAVSGAVTTGTGRRRGACGTAERDRRIQASRLASRHLHRRQYLIGLRYQAAVCNKGAHGRQANHGDDGQDRHRHHRLDQGEAGIPRFEIFKAVTHCSTHIERCSLEAMARHHKNNRRTFDQPV